MRRVILFAAVSVIALGLVGRAAATVVQEHDSTRNEVFTFHDTNICGNEAEWTIVVDSRTHVVDKGDGRFEYNFSQVYTYTLVFDDPTLGTWTAHATETIVHIRNGASDDVVHDNLSDREGPVQIIVHEQLRFDGPTVTVDREFELVAGC